MKWPWKKIGKVAAIGMKVAEFIPAATPTIKAIKIAVSLAKRARDVEADEPLIPGPAKKADVLEPVEPGPVRDAAGPFVDAYVALQNAVAESMQAAVAARVAWVQVRICVRQIAEAIRATKATGVESLPR